MEKPNPLALADFLNEYRRDNVTSISCANMMDAAAEMLRSQSTEVSRHNQDSYYPCKRMMLQEQPYADCFPATNCDGCDCWRSTDGEGQGTG